MYKSLAMDHAAEASSIDQHVATRVSDAALAAVRETLALAQQSTLMHRDLQPAAPVRWAAGKHVAVVLHGLFATAGALRPLRRALEMRTGIETATFSYEPCCNINTLVHRLATLLRDTPDDTHVHLIGHSLGGIVARYYVQVEPRDRRVFQTISLASPFNGTQLARRLPALLCGELRPQSSALRRLERHWKNGADTPHLSIVASHDQLVRPTYSAAYAHGDVVIAQARGHNALLFDRYVTDQVVARVALAMSDLSTMPNADHERQQHSCKTSSQIHRTRRPSRAA